MFRPKKMFIVQPEYSEWFCNCCGNHFKINDMAYERLIIRVIMCTACGSTDTEKVE